MNERGEEVKTISGGKGDHDISECLVVLNETAEIFPSCEGVGNGQINRVSGAPNSDHVTETKEHDANSIRPFRTLRSISQGTNQDDKDETNVKLQKNFKHNLTRSLAHEIEGISFRIRCCRCDKEEKGEIEIGKTGPRKDQLDEVVDKLQLQEYLPKETLTRGPDPPEENSSM